MGTPHISVCSRGQRICTRGRGHPWRNGLAIPERGLAVHAPDGGLRNQPIGERFWEADANLGPVWAAGNGERNWDAMSQA